jgi:hypothetical protein
MSESEDNSRGSMVFGLVDLWNRQSDEQRGQNKASYIQYTQIKGLSRRKFVVQILRKSIILKDEKTHYRIWLFEGNPEFDPFENDLYVSGIVTSKLCAGHRVYDMQFDRISQLC